MGGKEVSRSKQAVVRNPMMALPAFKQLRALPEDQRYAIRMLFLDLAVDARIRADKSWKSHKAPMAAYWKAVSVYAGHTARILK